MTYDKLLDSPFNMLVYHTGSGSTYSKATHIPSINIVPTLFLELTLSPNCKVDVENGSCFQSDTWERTCKVVSLASVA